jgi:hypothetical protein
VGVVALTVGSRESTGTSAWLASGGKRGEVGECRVEERWRRERPRLRLRLDLSSIDGIGSAHGKSALGGSERGSAFFVVIFAKIRRSFVKFTYISQRLANDEASTAPTSE